MSYLFTFLFTFFAPSTFAEEIQVFSTDSVGNRDYSKPTFSIQGDKVYETDSVGNRKYDGQSYQIENNQLKSIDTVGNKRY